MFASSPNVWLSCLRLCLFAGFIGGLATFALEAPAIQQGVFTFFAFAPMVGTNLLSSLIIGFPLYRLLVFLFRSTRGSVHAFTLYPLSLPAIATLIFLGIVTGMLYSFVLSHLALPWYFGNASTLIVSSVAFVALPWFHPHVPLGVNQDIAVSVLRRYQKIGAGIVVLGIGGTILMSPQFGRFSNIFCCTNSTASQELIVPKNVITLLRQLPNATIISEHAGRNGIDELYEISFQTSSTTEEIQQYYTRVLEEIGFIRDTPDKYERNLNNQFIQMRWSAIAREWHSIEMSLDDHILDIEYVHGYYR